MINSYSSHGIKVWNGRARNLSQRKYIFRGLQRNAHERYLVYNKSQKVLCLLSEIISRKLLWFTTAQCISFGATNNIPVCECEAMQFSDCGDDFRFTKVGWHCRDSLTHIKLLKYRFAWMVLCTSTRYYILILTSIWAPNYLTIWFSLLPLYVARSADLLMHCSFMLYFPLCLHKGSIILPLRNGEIELMKLIWLTFSVKAGSTKELALPAKPKANFTSTVNKKDADKVCRNKLVLAFERCAGMHFHRCGYIWHCHSSLRAP